MSEPRISIVIPAYNVAHYVDAAVQSVLRQTVVPYEILLFNDGSADETGAILSYYADHVLIRYFSQTNQGSGPTRNLGVERARGDYLYFFDADDLLEVGFIERMQQLIAENDSPDLIMFSGTGFTADDELEPFVKDYRRNGHAEGLRGIEALPLLDSNGWIYSSPCLYLTKISFWRDQGFRFPASLNEDEDIIVPLVTAARSVVIRDEIFFYRRIRQDSITTETRSHSHVIALESNLRQAIRDISLVPDSASKARKLLRKRCRIVATKYMEITQLVGSPVNRRLLTRAAARTGNLKLLRKALLSSRRC